VLVKALTPGFFAREDTATPVKVAALALVTNLVLNLLLMGPFKHVGIAMATVISSWLNAGLLAVILHRRGHLEIDQRLKRRLPRMALASAGMAALLALAMWGLEGALAGDAVQRITALAALVVGGLVVFGGLAHLTGAAALEDVRGLMRGEDAA